MKYILSLSCGKDSVALLLYLIDEQKKKDCRYPLDEVIQCEMEDWEFSCINDVSNQCKKLCEDHNIKFTKILIPTKEKFDKWGWCGGVCRYGTTAKIQAMSKYYKEHYPKDVIVEYLGYAKGEEKRINRYFNNTIKIYPLIENGINEDECLIMCYKNGFYWLESNGKRLYDYLDRVSCFCCRNKNLKELEAIYKHFNSYWYKLKEMQLITPLKFKKDYSLEELEFKFENKNNIKKEQLSIFDYEEEKKCNIL